MPLKTFKVRDRDVARKNIKSKSHSERIIQHQKYKRLWNRVNSLIKKDVIQYNDNRVNEAKDKQILPNRILNSESFEIILQSTYSTIWTISLLYFIVLLKNLDISRLMFLAHFSSYKSKGTNNYCDNRLHTKCNENIALRY